MHRPSLQLDSLSRQRLLGADDSAPCHLDHPGYPFRDDRERASNQHQPNYNAASRIAPSAEGEPYHEVGSGLRSRTADHNRQKSADCVEKVPSRLLPHERALLRWKSKVFGRWKSAWFLRSSAKIVRFLSAGMADPAKVDFFNRIGQMQTFLDGDAFP